MGTLVVFVVGTIGCESNANVAAVDGVIRLDGQPLSQGMVHFTPKAGRGAKGMIQSDGTFRLGTYSDADGALIGVHRVSITSSEQPTGPPNFDVDRPAVTKSRIPVSYASADTSHLTFEVKGDQDNHAVFDLTNK